MKDGPSFFLPNNGPPDCDELSLHSHSRVPVPRLARTAAKQQSCRAAEQQSSGSPLSKGGPIGGFLARFCRGFSLDRTRKQRGPTGNDRNANPGVPKASKDLSDWSRSLLAWNDPTCENQHMTGAKRLFEEIQKNWFRFG